MKVLVTRPAGQDERLARRIERLGHEVARCPLIRIEPLSDEPIDVTPYDWVVLTSANASRELRRRMRGTPRRVAAIGRATADAFGEVDVIARVSTQEGLLAEIPQPAGRVLFAAGEGARNLIATALHADTVTLYRTHELPQKQLPACDLVALTSPSAARALARSGGRIPAVSIGPQTTAAARSAGIEILDEATTIDLDGLVEAIARVATRQRPS
jgi:uroporphyrinogen III methyltransferase/synthase